MRPVRSGTAYSKDWVCRVREPEPFGFFAIQNSAIQNSAIQNSVIPLALPVTSTATSGITPSCGLLENMPADWNRRQDRVGRFV